MSIPSTENKMGNRAEYHMSIPTLNSHKLQHLWGLSLSHLEKGRKLGGFKIRENSKTAAEKDSKTKRGMWRMRRKESYRSIQTNQSSPTKVFFVKLQVLNTGLF